MNALSKSDLQLKGAPLPLRSRVRHYDEVAKEIESYLLKNPDEWGRFQSQFNQEINSIYREIMNFEKENLSEGMEEKVFKLKRLFTNKLRKYFLNILSISRNLRVVIEILKF